MSAAAAAVAAAFDDEDEDAPDKEVDAAVRAAEATVLAAARRSAAVPTLAAAVFLRFEAGCGDEVVPDEETAAAAAADDEDDEDEDDADNDEADVDVLNLAASANTSRNSRVFASTGSSTRDGRLAVLGGMAGREAMAPRARVTEPHEVGPARQKSSWDRKTREKPVVAGARPVRPDEPFLIVRPSGRPFHPGVGASGPRRNARAAS